MSHLEENWDVLGESVGHGDRWIPTLSDRPAARKSSICGVINNWNLDI